MEVVKQSQSSISCPYCNALLEPGVISCRHCSRDLTTVLPLIYKISSLETRLVELCSHIENLQPTPATLALQANEIRTTDPARVMGRRRALPLLVGFIALLLAYTAVVIWFDLSLSVLRNASIAIPLATGFYYLGARYKLNFIDISVATIFSVICVASMSTILAWVDNIPILPQDINSWKETCYYTFSIGASMLSGMFLRMSIMALASRGLTSLPQLRQGLLSLNQNMPLDTLKAIEVTVLMLTTILTAIGGLFAGLKGLTG